MIYINIFLNEIYKITFLLLPILVSVALIVWLDRRVWAFVKKRRGPSDDPQSIPQSISLISESKPLIDTYCSLLERYD